MKFLIEDDITNVTEEELEKDLLLLPEWRRVTAQRFKFLSGKVQSAKAYLLLRQALQEEYGIRDDSEFAVGRYGKPFLKDHPDIHFNLSHCKEAVMCVVDDHPVGCDIESVTRDPNLDLLKRTLSEAEQERVFGAEEPELEFMKLWTAKEAFLKQKGTGLADDLAGLFSDGVPEGLIIETTAAPRRPYVYSICRKS